MINMNEENEKMFHDGFRLLNSEIGNDHSETFFIIKTSQQGFRLLNSEIGNDPASASR